MQALGLISDAEIEGVRAEHSGQLPPYYVIGGLNRIIDDRVKPPKDWITYNWIFEGLRVGNFEGQVNGEANYRINASGTRGYHVSLRTNTNVVRDKDGKDMRVTTFNQQATQLSDNINSRIYEIPFSKDVVAALLKHTRDGQVSLSITQISTGKHYGIKSLDEFLTEDPLALLHSLSTPRPAIDSKLLLDELEQRAVQKAQRELEHHEQYG